MVQINRFKIYFVSKNSTIEIHRKAVAVCSHTCIDKGSMNENRPAFSLCGFAYKILIPI